MSLDLKNATKSEILQAYEESVLANKILQKSFEQAQEKYSISARAYESQVSICESYEREIEALKSRIKWFERQVFGVKSERLLPQDSRQGTFFDVPTTEPASTVTVKAFERRARKSETVVDEGERVRFSEEVPVDEVVLLPKEVEGLSDDAYEVISEKVTERLAYTPVQYRVKRTIRKTVKLKEELFTALAPEAVIERSFADVTLLAGLITDKFQYHIPLYRQHQRMQRAGVNISRGHLTKLTQRALELLEPVYQAVLSAIISRDSVRMDETPVKAGRKEKGVMKTAWFWPVLAEEQVAFVYSSTRSHKVVSEVLGKHCKKLLSDGYSAYGAYKESRPDLVHAQCWAHVRRKFFEAREHSPPECEKVLHLIGILFEIEQKAKPCELEEIAALRRERSFPVVEEFFSYLEILWFDHMLDSTSLLGKAVQYARNAESELRQFLAHPDIALSNNEIERAIRPVALGRKNWLFCWSELGAKHAAMAFTLIECCKMQGVDPFTYLVDVLQRIDSHPAKDVHLLTPKLWNIHFGKKSKNAA
jgi:transposase